MKKLAVDLNKCPQNHPCPSVKLWPQGALSQIEMRAPVVDTEKCVLCGVCVRYCGKQALYMAE